MSDAAVADNPKPSNTNRKGTSSIEETIALYENTKKTRDLHVKIRTALFLIIVAALVVLLGSLYFKYKNFNQDSFQQALNARMTTLQPRIMDTLAAAYAENSDEMTAGIQKAFTARQPALEQAFNREAEIFSDTFPVKLTERIETTLQKNVDSHIAQITARYPELKGQVDAERLSEMLWANMVIKTEQLVSDEMNAISESIFGMHSIINSEEVMQKVDKLSNHPLHTEMLIGAFLEMQSQKYPAPEVDQILESGE